MDDRLRPFWDFDDLDTTETRLRAQLDAEDSDDGRAEVLTQIARVEGLRGAFDRADALADEAEALATSGVARARLALERGRIRRSSGDRDAARPLFQSAYDEALAAEQYFMAADAAHMVALVALDRDDFVEWTNRGIELAEAHDAASHWLGPLLNNLGWEYYEAGELELALDAFERALAAREREPEKRGPIEIARYSVGKTLRALGRSAEAIPLLEQAVAWAESTGSPDGWFHEELAEEYAAVERVDEAREQARLAIALLERDDPAFAERRERLDSLGCGGT
ncbi:MAG TPA: tetratricopeptide repeat protein [Gaiellaceae bacterium]|nr:tetratricopeptide repeat protein [Gaiellaceae bacterium]